VPRVDEFAALLHMSREHLTRSFRSATGMTPGFALRFLQLRRAVKLLETTDLSTAEVARAAAYGSTRAFYRAFLRATGMSPSTHRRNSRRQ
jgi:AraC-like DNA-binding protein